MSESLHNNFESGIKDSLNGNIPSDDDDQEDLFVSTFEVCLFVLSHLFNFIVVFFNSIIFYCCLILEIYTLQASIGN